MNQLIRPVLFLLLTALSGGLVGGCGGAAAPEPNIPQASDETSRSGTFELRLVGDEGYRALTTADNEERVFVSERVLLDDSDIESVFIDEDSAVPKSEAEDQHSLVVQLTPEGAKRFSEITRQNVGRQIAIVIDGKVVAHPKIMEPIEGDKLQVTGPTLEELRRIEQKLSSQVTQSNR